MLLDLRTRVWNSPTFMTWASFAARSLSLVLVLPLIVIKLENPDIALWYLFGAALSLQGLAYAGFGSTFIRVIAFAYGGASSDNLRYGATEEKKSPISNTPNWEGISQILSNMNYIYRYLAIVLIIVTIASSLLLMHPISLSADPNASWIAWVIIGTGSFLGLRGSIFSVYLEGINQIALVRRWDALFGLAGIVSNFLVLIIWGNLISLVISSQFWLLINLPRNYFLCRKVENKVFQKFSLKPKFEATIFYSVWDSAWKSIVGTFMSLGVVQFSNMIYAQIGTSSMLASYLMGYNLLRQITTFSQAPFYSKLPLLARLRKQNNIKELLKIASRGMAWTYWLFIFCAIILGVFGNILLEQVGSNASFPPHLLWTTLAFGVLLERYGALHIQLYSTTNHILWHIVTIVSGTIYLLIAFLSLSILDVYAFPVALIVSNLAFYSWYCAKHSYKSLNTNFWKFDRNVFFPVLVLATMILLSVIHYEFRSFFL